MLAHLVASGKTCEIMSGEQATPRRHFVDRDAASLVPIAMPFCY
jgi:hypothetical protein